VERGDECPIGDRDAEIAQLVGERLETLAVVADGLVALTNGAQRRLQVLDARVAVVLEQILQLVPNNGGRGVLGEEAEELRRDARVDPLQDGEIVFDPDRIMCNCRLGEVDVGAETTAAEMDDEEMPPVIVVVRREVEDERDEGGDVGDGVANGGRGEQSGGGGVVGDNLGRVRGGIWGRKMAERAEMCLVAAGGDLVAAASHWIGKGNYPGVSHTMLD
jgi:hypothetical protein